MGVCSLEMTRDTVKIWMPKQGPQTTASLDGDGRGESHGAPTLDKELQAAQCQVLKLRTYK